MTIPWTTERFRLTPEEVEAERRYFIEERLGILCGADVPTDDQLDMAIREADEWVLEYYKNLT
jgi:hypothetical protein